MLQAIASFGSRLAPLLSAGKGAQDGGNLAFSPLGIHVVLSVLASGAAESSRAGLTQLLGLPLDQEFRSEYRALLGTLEQVSGVEHHVRLDCAQQLTPDAAWLASLLSDFRATFETQNFLNDPEGSTARIDAWFREETDGRIPFLYGSHVLPKKTTLVASSALTFRNHWATWFSSLETAPRAFILEGGQSVSVSTMRAEELPILVGRLGAALPDVAVGSGVPGPIWVAIPFSGETTYLLLGLPATTVELPRMEQQLSDPGVLNILTGLTAGKPEVLLPKIDWLTPTVSLTEQIQKLQGGSALESLELSRVGFSAPFALSTLVQRVAVQWDEKGADLAAATSGSVAGIGLATAKPIAFDHPFVFAVVERETGLILFQGRVMDPRSRSEAATGLSVETGARISKTSSPIRRGTQHSSPSLLR